MAKDSKLLKEETQQLPVALSKEDMLAAGALLAGLEAEMDAAQEEFTTVKKGHRERMQKLLAERKVTARFLRERQAMRPVTVEVHADYRRNVATYVRTDTGEVLNERPLAPDERQEVIDFPEDKPKRRAAGSKAEASL
jgi:phosphosulfolactate phosphohydrolase-like enzyme